MRPAGLLPYVAPQLQRPGTSLDVGEYIPKAPDADVGVETLIRAAAAAGASLAGSDIVSYRNNLNK